MCAGLKGLVVGAVIVCLLFGVCMALAGLAPCPDCGKLVSTPALFCPNCGCPGEVIAKAAQKAATNQAPARPAFHHSLIEVRSNQGEGWGVAVTDGTATQVVTSLDLLGAQLLELKSWATTAAVAYVSIELADDCPLARFRTADTNLVALRWETGATEGLLVLPDGRTNGLRLVAASVLPNGGLRCPTESPRLVGGIPVLGPTTNLLAVVASSGFEPSVAARASATRRWVPLQPSDFRRQMALLSDVRAALAAVPSDQTLLANRLRQAAWSTSYLKELAARLAAQLEAKDKP